MIGEAMKLHIGGKQPKPGWKILNIQYNPGVDFIGDISDLSQFLSESCDEIYASHVLEHISQQKMLATLRGLHRILKPEGKLMISVPDLDVLCHLFIHPKSTRQTHFDVMRIMFGGQKDAHDFHCIGLNFEILSDYLSAAGFTRIERVKSFGLFEDFSNFAPYGVQISLNIVVWKLV
jgi:predicted SAM-dependent methyltransferase